MRDSFVTTLIQVLVNPDVLPGVFAAAATDNLAVVHCEAELRNEVRIKFPSEQPGSAGVQAWSESCIRCFDDGKSDRINFGCTAPSHPGSSGTAVSPPERGRIPDNRGASRAERSERELRRG